MFRFFNLIDRDADYMPYANNSSESVEYSDFLIIRSVAACVYDKLVVFAISYR